MEMLRSEVKLLLLRNKQLENENLLLKQNELKLNESIFKEKHLNRVLENIKLAQNEYISKLNQLLIELTQENGNENSYNTIQTDINNCIQICKQLQNEYEFSKQSINAQLNHQKSLLESNESLETTPEESAEPNVDESDNEDFGDDFEFEFDDEDNEDEEEEEPAMPELDLIGAQDLENNGGGEEEEEDDDDPNGAGEQYLDRNDKEFVPKRTLSKSARKSFVSSNAQRIALSPKRKKSEKKSLKTSQKFGDKFRCNWEDCCFISSYKQNVERHYRVHTGERPFKCQFKGCGFSASQAGNLKVHQQRHGHHTPNAHKIRVKSTHNAVKATPVKASPVKGSPVKTSPGKASPVKTAK